MGHFPPIVVDKIIQGLTVNFSEISILSCFVFFSNKILSFFVSSDCVFYMAFSRVSYKVVMIIKYLFDCPWLELPDDKK